MIGSLDMDGLRAFVAVVDSMSFSRAGEMVGRSQSAISLRLRHLERDLGLALLIRRQGKIIEVTDNGLILLDFARKIVALNDAAVRELAKMPRRDRIRVGLTADIHETTFPDARKATEATLGGLSLEIEIDVSDHLRNRCLSGDLDFAFYKFCGPDGVGKPLAPLPLAWLGAVDFTLNLKEPVPLVCFPEGCAYRKAMLQPLREAGLPHQIVATASTHDNLRKAVLAGLGVTALPPNDPTLIPVAGLPALGDISLAMVLVPGVEQVIRRIAEGLGAALIVHGARAARRLSPAQEALTSSEL